MGQLARAMTAWVVVHEEIQEREQQNARRHSLMD